jgi:hypothetical protein
MEWDGEEESAGRKAGGAKRSKEAEVSIAGSLRWARALAAFRRSGADIACKQPYNTW